MQLAIIAACSIAVAPVDPSRSFGDTWFDQWEVTDKYLASDGTVNRLPIRLMSHESILTGTAEWDVVAAELQGAGESFVPVSVGGKVPMQLWMNNFTDTDCGPAGAGAYLETWVSFPVAPLDKPVHLPYKTDMDYVAAQGAAGANGYVHRVLCANAPGNAYNAAMGAIAGGREIFGYPKHHIPAEISLSYDGNATQFDVMHLGHPVFEMRMVLPEHAGAAGVPLAARLPADAGYSGPRWLVKQTRYGQAFNYTAYTAPWDPATDSLKISTEKDGGWDYGMMLNRWGFTPKLKQHSTDFKIVAFKPAGWQSP